MCTGGCWEFSPQGSRRACDPSPTLAFLKVASGWSLPPGLVWESGNLGSSSVTLGKSLPFSESEFLEL